MWELSRQAIEFEAARYQDQYKIAEVISNLRPLETRFFTACLDYDGAVRYRDAVEDLRSGYDHVESNMTPWLGPAQFPRDDREFSQNEIETIHEGEWHQGFGSECKEHIGQDKGGYYYALEIGDSEDDLSWHGPYETREEAEQELSDAFLRWDERTGDREQAWEDQQIAHFEQEHDHGMEIER
jgi:hypothetical protein